MKTETPSGNGIANAGDGEVLVREEGVSKKFCRSLKKSLWYGVRDIVSELNPFHKEQANPDSSSLRDDEFWALQDISFELRSGQCLGLIGTNGAGKTTLLKMLNGLIKPDRGRIEMRGRMGALIALGAGFNPILTGRENIYVNGAVLGLSKKEIEGRIEEIIDFADIRDFIDAPVQTYSSGMQVRLGFAIATAMKPDVLLLDEVLAVGDAAFRVKCFNRMHETLGNSAVIFVSHNMAQITRVCNQVMMLQNGRAVAHDRNLGKVISKYYQTIAVDRKVTVEGPGYAVLHRIQIQDAAGSEISVLPSGSPFAISVSFTLLKQYPPSALRLLVVITNEELVNVAQFEQAIGSAPTGRPVQAKISFQTAPFNAGRFSVSVGILAGARGEVLCVTNNGTSFVVENDTVGYAPILIEPTAFEATF